MAQALAAIWCRIGVPAVAQFDNHSNLSGRHPAGVRVLRPGGRDLPRPRGHAPVHPTREPWRNGVVEHFNDVWDKSFFRTERFADLGHLRAENAAFADFHNTRRRYSVHKGQRRPSCGRPGTRARSPPPTASPTRLPARGRIEVVRYVRSNRVVDLSGKRIVLAEEHAHQYVTAFIKVRSQTVIVVAIELIVRKARNRNDLLLLDHLPCRNDVLQVPHLGQQQNGVLWVKR